MRQQVKLSDTIKRIRTEKRISQAEIARRLNLERGNYSRLENRGEKLSIEQLTDIAHALDLKLLDVLTYGNEGKDQTLAEADEYNANLRTEVEMLRSHLSRANNIIDTLMYSLNTEKEAKETQEEDIIILLSDPIIKEKYDQIMKDRQERKQEAKRRLIELATKF